MSSQHIGIHEARPKLGDLVTAVQQGADIVLTRNGKPVARIVRYQEDTMVTVYELAARVDMAAAPEKVARYAGCLTEHDPRTGRLPKPWHGQGMDATFTHDQAEQIEVEWRRDARNALFLAEDVPGDTEFAEIAERYRP